MTKLFQYFSFFIILTNKKIKTATAANPKKNLVITAIPRNNPDNAYLFLSKKNKLRRIKNKAAIPVYRIVVNLKNVGEKVRKIADIKAIFSLKSFIAIRYVKTIQPKLKRILVSLPKNMGSRPSFQ